MAKCTNCNSTILLGGKKLSKYTFCDDGCMAKFKIGLVDQYMSPVEVDKAVDEIYSGKCPSCRGDGPVDLYSSNKVTGMIVAYTAATETAVCCVSCGRKMKLKAALHCAFLGWWGVKAAIHNIIYLPKNLIGAAMTIKDTRILMTIKDTRILK